MKLQDDSIIVNSPGQLRILTVTWNLLGSIPPEKYLVQLFENKEFRQNPDIIFIGTQECQISLFWAFFYGSKPLWEECLRKHFGRDYQLLPTNTLQGVHSAVLILKKHKDQTFLVSYNKLRAGFCCNLFGNKGAVEIKIKIYGQYIQFINCHLAPHQDNAHHRNQTLIRILNNLACTNSSTEVILLGDMNYRLQMKNEQYAELMKRQTPNNNTEAHMRYLQMIDMEQLRNQQQLKQRFFPTYQQGKIRFPPSYKLMIDQNIYNRKRVPGWTDRIFNRKGNIKRLNYQCQYDIYGSDHRPIYSTFQLQIQEGLSIFQDEAFQSSACQII